MCLISVEFKGWENGANVQQNKKIKAEFDSYMVADKNVYKFFFISSSGKDIAKGTQLEVISI